MQEKKIKFLKDHIEIFEYILDALWKEAIEIQEKKVYSSGKKLIIDFILDCPKIIRLEMVLDTTPKKQVNRFSIAYKLHYGNPEQIENYLVLSFLYHCPYDLELCNQYGLYTKEDVKKMEQLDDPKELKRERKSLNLLEENQFYIFNMNRIGDFCADQVLNEIVEKIHKMVLEWNSNLYTV